MHSLLGALVGAFVITYLIEFLRVVDDVSWVPSSLTFLASWRLVVYGVLVMILMAVLPEGLVSRRAALRLTAPVRRLHAPVPAPPEVVPAAAEPVTTDGDAVLEIEDVSHRFAGVQALDGVSLSVMRGEILALVGANGAGKSTLIDVVAGRWQCQQGSIRLGGADITGLRPEARVRAGVARTFQSVRMLDHLTVEEVVRLGRLPAAQPPPIDDILALVQLDDRPDALPGQLTLADQRRLEVGRAWASSPQVLLLDEPSVGMNAEERAELSDLVRRLRKGGASIVLVDHNLDLVLGVADRVVVLDFGKVLATGSPGEIIEDPRVRAAYLGVAPLAGSGGGVH